MHSQPPGATVDATLRVFDRGQQISDSNGWEDHGDESTVFTTGAGTVYVFEVRGYYTADADPYQCLVGVETP